MSEIPTYPNEEDYEIERAIGRVEAGGQRVVISRKLYEELTKDKSTQVSQSPETGTTAMKCVRCKVMPALPGFDFCYGCDGSFHTPSMPNDLREKGWRIAIHNDYRMSGGDYTFYLLTKAIGGEGNEGVTIAIKGEGDSDALALNHARVNASIAEAYLERGLEPVREKEIAELREINERQQQTLRVLRHDHETVRRSYGQTITSLQKKQDELDTERAKIQEWREASARLQQEALDLRSANEKLREYAQNFLQVLDGK